jgi:hypothetical protein
MAKNPPLGSSNEFLNFSDIFSEVLTLLDNDPIEHFVVLTYEFDEQQLLNLAVLRALEEPKGLGKSGLKLLSSIRPVVFFDARKTRPFGSLPQFLELHPCKTKGFSCHHSKAYCIVTRKTIRLMVGSFNLTFSGLFRNREVFESWCWESAESPDTHLLFEWMEFLKRNYLTEARASSASALATVLATLEARTADWIRPAEPASHFLASGYDGQQGIDALVASWREWYPGQSPNRLFAVSPFFDEIPQFGSLAGELRGRFPSLSDIEIVTDEAVLPNLSQAHFGPSSGRGLSTLRLIPEALSEQERQRIEGRSGSTTKNLVVVRPLHAKVLILSRNDGDGLAYLGSANFSRKAWLGANRELGLVWRIDSAKALRDDTIAALSVASPDRFPELPPLPPAKLPKPDEESVEDDSLFPGFIDYIVLEPADSEGHLAFRVHGDDVSRLDGFEIRWTDLTLNFSEGRSQAILLEEFRNALLGGRTIEFRPREVPGRCFWFPFQYAGELIAEREALMHASSWDWLSFYLNPDVGDGDEDPEKVPGMGMGTPDPLPVLSNDVDRDANCVIAMQRYLTLFSRVESAFESRLKSVAKIDDAAAREQAVKTQVFDPLAGLATLLEREPMRQPEDRLFKLGELRLLVGALSKASAATEHSRFEPLIVRLDGAMKVVPGEDQMRSDYRNFVSQLSVKAI